MKYDVIIVGAGPGGIFSAYELTKENKQLKVLVLEAGNPLEKRKCPIDGKKITSCINCKPCAIMNGFGGAGAFSDGKYNITNEFGGNLYEYVGKKEALDLMNYIDEVNVAYGGKNARKFSTANSELKKKCLQNDLHLLDASVRHLGTDINYVILENLYNELKEKVHFQFMTHVDAIDKEDDGYVVKSANETFYGEKVIISTGRSGSKWMQDICDNLQIETKSNRVDIGVRVEIPAAIFEHITEEVYESKIVYRTEKFQDLVRTFCMNPKGVVVSENTNGIITVNGHSYEDKERFTENTNFALLVSMHFTDPFKNSNEYGESIARLSNMLGGGIIVQRFGDLIRGQRSTPSRIEGSFLTPTYDATPGDLSLVIPKRQMDDIIEMIYALDKIAPGMASDDTLLYGVEVKFYNLQVEVDHHLETKHKGLYVIGDCSGVTHSLSHASASGVYVARKILEDK
ncbi:MAG: NAD(P)/FAD-dependent oxidoreductase [Erysipelotrichia bacterium]|nr:NAD(P)/FAD-dependent oxidoreductase [Erysipelotrichia bacterium]NCC54297.1 NAD(P)/FAD-dependent oxidoreductase [Erysipelotrichia bacterium]